MDGDVFVGLNNNMSVSLSSDLGSRLGVAHKLQFPLAAIFDLEREGCLQAGRGILDVKECLVRSLCFAAFLGREKDLEGVLRS